MTWDPITDPVDYVMLAGRRTPGLAELTGFASPRRWDERRGYALSGSTVVFRGIGLARGKLVIRLYSEQDWADWHAFAPVVQRPPPMERPRALEIVHPITEGLGVRAVVVEDVTQPTQTGHGEWTIEITLLEFRRPTIALAVPDAAQEQPVDPVDRYIEQLTGQVQELAR